MINFIQAQSSIIYLGIFLLALCLITKENESKYSKKTKAMILLVIAVGAGVVKLGLDYSANPTSYYSILETPRHGSVLDIRKSYKSLSRKLHPDKNPEPGAEARFQQVKEAYDTLMDEALRDAYNRFGASALVFDPRKDEMKLITDTSMGYIFWAVCAYLATLPTGVRAARNWIAIIGIIILSVEVCFSLTETTIPSWMPEYLTEADLVYYLHALFPMLIAFLCVLADYLYVDPDKTALAVLKEMTENQKAMVGLLSTLQEMVGLSAEEEDSKKADRIDSIKEKIANLCNKLDETNEVSSRGIQELQDCSANPGANYYWILFVILYGGVYFLQ